MSSAAPPETPPPASPSTVNVSRTIFSRSTDLLAISLVLIVGLTAGREIIQWWRADDAQIAATGLTDPQIEWSLRPLEIQLGDSSAVIQRIPFTGDRPAAEQQLLELARTTLLAATNLPAESTAEAEAWVAELERLQPTISLPQHGNIYLVPGILPSVAVTQLVPQPAQASARLVTWGLAAPLGEHHWTLMLFGTVDSKTSRQDAVSLPAGAARLLSWKDAAGNQVVSFQGTGSLAAWGTHFEGQFGQAASGQSDAQRSGYVARWQTDRGLVDVQLAEQGAQIVGLLWITAAKSDHNRAGAVSVPPPSSQESPHGSQPSSAQP